jgi:hypothetical protein
MIQSDSGHLRYVYGPFKVLLTSLSISSTTYSFGEHVYLNDETTQDVCFLLSAFFSALPELPIDPALFVPFLD